MLWVGASFLLSSDELRMSYAAPDRFVTPDDDPRDAWDTHGYGTDKEANGPFAK
jgi:hypothetical protein